MKLLKGDCLEVLRSIESESIDSLVTDPPAGISFMGKEWDHHKGGRKEWVAWMTEIMSQCLRVMKPGAHGLVWALPRTSHWTATALEDAGFEVRDIVTHLFGSGFPKSLDISKAIDKAAGVQREVVGTKDVGPDMRGGNFENAEGRMIANITAPATDSAKQWSGWGTALKPASEHWILIRKPIDEKTVAANVLKYGTGGINIDASRIATDECLGREKPKPSTFVAKIHETYIDNSKGLGRFPANLVLSHSAYCTDDQCDIECAIKQLDEQSGTLKTNSGKAVGSKAGFTKLYGSEGEKQYDNIKGDSGGASRFFYCAKISTSERGEGNNHPTVKPKKLMSYLIKMVTPTNGVVLDPFMGSGSTGIAAKENGFGFVGIEREQEYFEIASKRIGAV